jgi:hypothetical protein
VLNYAPASCPSLVSALLGTILGLSVVCTGLNLIQHTRPVLTLICSFAWAGTCVHGCPQSKDLAYSFLSNQYHILRLPWKVNLFLGIKSNSLLSRFHTSAQLRCRIQPRPVGLISPSHYVYLVLHRQNGFCSCVLLSASEQNPFCLCLFLNNSGSVDSQSLQAG